MFYVFCGVMIGGDELLEMRSRGEMRGKQREEEKSMGTKTLFLFRQLWKSPEP